VAPFNPGPSLVVISGTGLARQIPVPFKGIVLGRDDRLGPPFSTDEYDSRSHVWVRAPTRMQDSDMLRIGRIQLKLTAPGELDQAMATRERQAPLLGRETRSVR
jgi:hypothetical protein